MPGVYLSVCLLATLSKKPTKWLFVQILTQMCVWTRKNRLNFGRHPPSNPDDRRFNCISGESDYIFVKISSQMYPWTRKSPLNYASNPNPESGYGLQIQTRISLVEVCGLCLLLLHLLCKTKTCFIDSHRDSNETWCNTCE